LPVASAMASTIPWALFDAKPSQPHCTYSCEI